MTPVFADTFYWIALADFTDSAHQAALAVTKERAASSIVTTDEVLVEYLTFFATASQPLRRAVAASVFGLLTNPAIRVIPQSRSSFVAGLELYARRPDKSYSLTDCISMAAMRSEGLTEVLTNDRHFEQEGFRALFREAGLCSQLAKELPRCLPQHLPPHRIADIASTLQDPELFYWKMFQKASLLEKSIVACGMG